MCFAPQQACTFSSSQLPKVLRAWCVFVHFDFEMCFEMPQRALFHHLNFQKCSETWCVLYILTSKRASRHNGVHFFDISTSKSAPTLVCFVRILTWKCASRHNGVQFFISHLARWLRTRRFSEPTFRTFRSHKSLEKTQWIATFLPFRAPASSFFWLFLFSDLLSSSLLFSDSSHLCFFICPYWHLEKINGVITQGLGRRNALLSWPTKDDWRVDLSAFKIHP